MGSFFIVGVGPGAPEYLTERARRAIEHAELVLGFAHALAAVQNLLAGKEVVVLRQREHEQQLTALQQAVALGRRCVVACTGDPLVSDWQFVAKVQAAAKDVEIVPGISSVQVAAARAGLALDASFYVSFHLSGDLEERKAWLAEALHRGQPAIVLPRPWDFMPKDIGLWALEIGLSPELPVRLYERLTLPDECTWVGRLGELAHQEAADLCVLVMGNPYLPAGISIV